MMLPYRNSIFSRKWTASVLLLASTSAWSLTLPEALTLALGNDPQFRTSVALHAMAQEHKVQGRAALLPRIGLDGNYGSNDAIIESLDRRGRKLSVERDYISRAANLSLRQPLFNLEALARNQQGYALTEQGNAEFESSRSEVVLRTTAAYLSVLRGESEVELTLRELERLTEQGVTAEKMFGHGEGTKTELLEIEARTDILRARLNEIRLELSARRVDLKAIIGVDPSDLARLSNTACFTGEVPELEHWRTRMHQRNADILAVRLAVKIAEIEIKKSRAAYAPKVELVVNLSRADSESVTTYNQSNFNNFVGVVLNMPLYQGGAAASTSRQAVAGLARARASLDQAINVVDAKLMKEYAVVSNGKEKFKALNKAVSSSNELIAATKGGIQGGIRVNLDLMNATQQLFLAERDLAEARYAYIASSLQLRGLAGSLGYGDIAEASLCFSDTVQTKLEANSSPTFER